MKAITIYESIVVVIILCRLIMLRSRNNHKPRNIRFTWWLAIVVTCMILIRLTDRRIVADTLQLSLMVLVALALWANEIMKDE
ncbi:hypothetical protein SMY46_004299 [Cronobacter turicensis]|uniref:hypothetical protein n=1 Tax=Cronobacter turicensis TaxID=413502 RepID=UPI0011ABDA71|nr:hypothetical protein [Cronobacter turicensis]EKY3120767.1 hypothetical protein [Cronobacter turicensis]ELU8452887.1 hypothetical protein [Cronobacter turicensis]ELY4112555.1 hypothetical protein [Cronobacter turicensis]ELY4215766.1 hypothetical protein [Cronobacter turicensis]EMA1789807.1 hypothetical protein [Cronobacter turicensis]